jgi:uncharacterized tellurite resistance protein B-like protein
MAKVKTSSSSATQVKRRSAISIENKENQMIAAAYNLVEQRLMDGTASSQETVHFLKLGSTKYKLEMERLRNENELLKAKTSDIETNKEYKTLVEEAMKAFRGYQGSGEEDEYYD